MSQPQVAVALKARFMTQLPSSIWTQNSYCGLGQPPELAVKLTIEPAGALVEGGARPAEVQPVSVTVSYGCSSTSIVPAYLINLTGICPLRATMQAAVE